MSMLTSDLCNECICIQDNVKTATLCYFVDNYIFWLQEWQWSFLDKKIGESFNGYVHYDNHVKVSNSHFVQNSEFLKESDQNCLCTHYIITFLQMIPKFNFLNLVMVRIQLVFCWMTWGSNNVNFP